ncbi:hypothetical protein [Mucilaginibacter aquatilis]|uniref:Uncharacterized protein n=1 Tax=Mucilaginibacter aquatilis TaxID=1517760 RepID=A0A6I4I6P7_9SPHI|nr:hypothetical protein [Mucilaginibacter aquatilis]MVN90885.1 hypothetical protein [Mucilaginibacter aquatilis]
MAHLEAEELIKYFNFKYEGENYINYSTLFNSQNHILTALLAIQRKYFPTNDFEIKIGTFKEGSFEVPYLIDFTLASTHLLSPLLNKDNLDILHKSLAALVSILTIHKTFKGEKPKQEIPKGNGTTDLNFGNENIFNVENFHLHIYKGDTVITNNISKGFAQIEQDQKIKGVNLYIEEKSPLIKLNREDIADLAKTNPYQRKEEKESIATVKVFVKKANLFKDKKGPWKWEFIYNGRVIKAIINDINFEQAVKGGKVFRQGTRLVVDLKKISVWSPKYNGFLVKGYEIVKVYENTDSVDVSDQRDLFDD